MRLLVIDGNSIANRAFYGIKLLTTKKGVFTNAVTGFFNIYLKLNKAFAPDAVAVAFDLKAPTFRHKKYAEYKGTRKGMPDELAMQMPYIKRILTALGVKVLECEGWEADDILGTLSADAEKTGNTCVIATGDRDSFQLVTEKVTVNLASMKEDIVYTPEKIREVYGVEPKQMIEIKALMGDSSDNIPGVAGIGEKTALSLIQNYHDCDNIYEKLSELPLTAGVKNKLEKGKEMCFLSRELGTISLEAPVSDNINDYRLAGRDEPTLAAIFTELEMLSMMKKFGVTAEAAAAENVAAVSEPSEHILPEGCDIISDGEEWLLCENGSAKPLLEDELFELLKSDKPKRSFNVKELWTIAHKNGFELKNIVFDTTLAAYLLNVNSAKYTLELLSAENSVRYSEEREGLADCLKAVNERLYSRLCEEKSEDILYKIEIPLAEVLTGMETDGISIDAEGVNAFGAGLLADIASVEGKIYELSGKRFNIASPKQLGEVLFDDLMLPSGKKTKTGYSTNSDVLEFLMDKHPIVPLISEYRALTKLNSTYVNGLLKVVCDDGRIHTTFKQTETRTGRISSVEPNIQNIPVRTPLGRKMRAFFVAKEGCRLVDADYSQIELRVLAHISGDVMMQGAFKSGEDIHRITASQVFNQPLEWVTPEMRSRAKAVNFGIVYGIGAFSLSKDIGVSVSEADRYIKAYLEKYSKVDAYMKKTVSDAKKNGYVETMLGRRRYIPEINSVNKNIQALGSRMAMNTPIQGTAADIIKLAMINVYNRLKKSGLSARLILQVHDELIVECAEDAVEEVEVLLKEEMENAVKLDIPLTVDVNSGKTWFDAH